MELTRFDAVILVGMTLGIVFMSFTFPALGMSDESAVNATDVPEFNMSSDRFDFAGDFPNRPGTPDVQYLRWLDEAPGTEVTGRDLNEYRITLTEVSNVSGQGNFWTLNVTLFDDTNGVVDRVQFSNATDKEVDSIQGQGWDIAVELTQTRGSDPDDFFAEVGFRVLESGSSTDDGFFAGLPVIGSIFDVGSSVASAVAWIGTVIWWFVTYLFEIAATLVVVLFETIAFTFGLVQFLLSTYFSVVSAATAPWSAFLVVPGLILFVEFAKIGMIGVSLLPTT